MLWKPQLWCDQEVGLMWCWDLPQTTGPTSPGQHTVLLHAPLGKLWVILAGNCGTVEFSGVRTVCLGLTTFSPAEARTARRPGLILRLLAPPQLCLFIKWDRLLHQEPLIKVAIKEPATRQTNWLRKSLPCLLLLWLLSPPVPSLPYWVFFRLLPRLIFNIY